jgi:hypothetical protein
MRKRLLNPLYGVHELRDALKGEELALNGDENRIGSYESVEGEKVKGGGAIDQDVIEAVLHLLEGVPQRELSIRTIDEFQVDPDQVPVPRQKGEAFAFRRHDGIRGLFFADEHVVERNKVLRILGYSKASSGIALWIGVH